MCKISLLCSLLVLVSCGTTPTVHLLADADSWNIPVAPAKIVPAKAGDGIKSEEATEMVITVPPSDKPTKIEVRKAKRTMIDKALTNKAAYNVKSDNPEAKAVQPKRTIWWRWAVAGALGLVILCALIMAIAHRVANFSPMGFIRKLFGR